MADQMRGDAAGGKIPHEFRHNAVDYAYASGLPQPVLASLKACGLEALAGSDTIALSDLNASMDQALLEPSQRIVLKRELVARGKVTD
jgi:hypothetical protein